MYDYRIRKYVWAFGIYASMLVWLPLLAPLCVTVTVTPNMFCSDVNKAVVVSGFVKQGSSPDEARPHFS